MTHPNYLTADRKTWELSEEEVAALAGVCRSVITRAEIGEEPPSLRTALALHLIFGRAIPDTFSKLYEEIQEVVVARAVELDEALRDQVSLKADRKREFLSDFARRNNPLPA